MRHPRLVLLCLVCGLVQADLASAAGFGLFQHGGRAMGQAGAFTARASEPSAVTYNPAAITQLEGLQAQAGLDLSHSTDKYESPTGGFAARHIIDFPPAAYLTWKPGAGPFAFGIGLDAPFWTKENWDPALFPGRFLTRKLELTVFELHPVIAWDLGAGWSVGGGLRYVAGTLDQENNTALTIALPNGQRFTGELERKAESDVDDLTWDLAVHYAAPSWGWGAVYRAPTQLKGSGDVTYEPRDFIAEVEPLVRAANPRGGARQAFEIPREIRGGVWYAPYPELRLELDASWQSWSSLEATSLTISSPLTTQSETELTPRDWDDTLGLRLGAEGNITDNFLLFGGLAWEPSPVPGSTIEPGFPRGDALVYATGFSYNFPQISFDVGYSYHDHDNFGASGQEPNPTVRGTYSSRVQVWGFSVRWRW
jgi:long-chain fatty acid transport protein